MPAVVTVQEITGDPGSKVYTSITDRVRLFSDDVATNQVTPQTTNAVKIPDAGDPDNYSYWKAICLDLSGSGFTITNIRHYSHGDIDWTFGSDGELRRGNQDSGDIGCPDASYEQAGGIPGTSGYAIEDLVDGHTFYNDQTTKTKDLNLDLVGAPPVVDSGPYTVAGKTKHIVVQVRLDEDAIQGLQTPKELTWVYDEQ